MPVCFFDSKAIGHKELMPPGQTVNQYFHKELLKRLGKQGMRVRSKIIDTFTDYNMLHYPYSIF